MTKTGTLKHGLKVGETRHTEFEIREATTGDLFAAELQVDPKNGIAFSGQMLCQQLVRIGSYTGPFTIEVIGMLKPTDYDRLQSARLALEAEGEAEQLG